MRFLQKPKHPRLGISRDSRASDKRSEDAKGTDPQGELSTFFATVKKRPETEGKLSNEMPSANEFNHTTEAWPVQSHGRSFIKVSPTPMAPDMSGSQLSKHDLPGAENSRRTPTNFEDPSLAGIMPREQTTPRPSTLSTLLSEPYTWSPSLLGEGRDKRYAELEDQSHQQPVMLPSRVLHETVPGQQPLRSRHGHDLYAPTYFGLYEAGIRSVSAQQPNQELSEAPKSMKGFWRPHKLY